MVGGTEGDGVAAGEGELAGGVDLGDAGFDGGWVDGVGGFAEEAEEDGAVGGVADAGVGEGAVEVDAEGLGAVYGGAEFMEEAEGGAHGSDRVGARGLRPMPILKSSKRLVFTF